MISKPPNDAEPVPQPVPNDEPAGRAVLDLAHALLARDQSAGWPLGRVMAEVAAAAGAEAAGLAELATAKPVVRHAASSDAPPAYPWNESGEVLAQLRDAWTAVAVTAGNRSWLLAPAATPAGAGGWLLWVEAGPDRSWTTGEQAALMLTAQVLARAPGGSAAPLWGRQLDRLHKQQRLEDAALVVRRLAHDYGNILTTVLGFSELGLSLPNLERPLAGYLKEIHKAAELGSLLTDQLRLFSRRGQPGPRSAHLPAVLAQEVAGWKTSADRPITLELDVPHDLPPVYITAELVRRVLHELLENAREALTGGGAITVSARAVELSETDCLDLFGAASPGPAVEVSVADSGPGLTPEANAAVLSSPVFTTKSRHRGLGLATVYGILRQHGGGVRLDPRPGGGTIARVVLPQAASATSGPPEKAAVSRGTPSPATSAKEKVLVVDDDPMILRLVTMTLERDGYRVQTALGGAEALQRYTTAAAEPFRLVLSDVLMPSMSGVDLARRLVQHDATVNLLFMSGQVSADFRPESWGGSSFPLLRKPFRPEGLLQAVRAALEADRSRPRPGLPAPLLPENATRRSP